MSSRSSDTNGSLSPWFPWLGAGLGGAVWGAGAARALAHDAYCSFCYEWAGVLLGAALGALLAVVGCWLLQRQIPASRVRPLWFLPLYLPLLDVLSAGYQPWRAWVLLVGGLFGVWIAVTDLTRLHGLGLAFLVPLVVYLPDISPYVGRADTFEFQVIGPQLGVAHPSGYPLYTLVCKAFSLLPMGTMAWRINLSSAIFAALASAFLFLALDAKPPKGRLDRPLALGAALMLSFSPTLWSRAIEAEVYALNAALVAIGLWLAVRWHGGQIQTARAWPAFGFLVGLAVASHITLGALSLVAASGLLVPRLRPDRRAWLLALGLGVLGVSLYVYIPLRWPAVTDGEFMSLGQFWRFVTNADSGGALRPLAFYQDPTRWHLVGRLLLNQVGWPGLVLAAIGPFALGRAYPALNLGLLSAAAAWVWFNLSFYVADPDYSAFLIPAHTLVLFYLGWAARSLSRRLQTPALSLGTMIIVLMLLISLNQIWRTGPEIDTISQGRADEAWARYALQQPLSTDATVLADSEKFPPLYYLQQVEGIRTDLELVTLFSEAQYREALEARLAAGQAVYLARYLPGVEGYGVSSVGPLVGVGPRGAPAADGSDGIRFGDALVLVGSTLEADPLGRPMHHLTLSWYAKAPMEDDIDIRFRLLDAADGATLWEMNGGRPVNGYASSLAWEAGDQVRDYHVLEWPAWIPGGVYALEVGVFPHFGSEGLPVDRTAEVWHRVDRVTLRDQGFEPLSRRHRILAGPYLWLVGSQMPAEVSTGSPFDLDLAWVCRRPLTTTPYPELVWRLMDGTPVGVQALRPLGIGSGSVLCRAGPTSVIRRHAITAPDQPGRYRLEVRWPGPEDTARQARCTWLGRPRTQCSIGAVTVIPAAQGLASFQDKILLVDAAFNAENIPAGGPLRVHLTWRSLQELDKDYTVFVQVVGPDGKLYGQVDGWPVQGARPTSGWRPSEQIEDPYEFYVDAGGPPGEYRVIAGFYLLADMSRLPVVDPAGREVGDFYELGTFEVR